MDSIKVVEVYCPGRGSTWIGSFSTGLELEACHLNWGLEVEVYRLDWKWKRVALEVEVCCLDCK